MGDAQQVPFPQGHGSTTLTSRRGRQVRIRHIRPDDDALLVELFHQLSEQTRRLRFFTPLPDLPDTIVWREAHLLADSNPLQAAALIALIDEDGREQAVGVVRLAADSQDPTTAEVAIVLRDDYQGEGLGTQLFDMLVQVALVRGLRRLRAVALVENEAVHKLVTRVGLPVEYHVSRGEMTMIITLSE
jgi:RimJ/RimL family protein N-acetyltransferase